MEIKHKQIEHGDQKRTPQKGACVRRSAIFKAAPCLLSHWTQIKAFHSNSLSGNRGTRYFIYNFSYAAAGAKWFTKVWHLNKSRKHVIFSWHFGRVQGCRPFYNMSFNYSMCYISSMPTCPFFLWPVPFRNSARKVTGKWNKVCFTKVNQWFLTQKIINGSHIVGFSQWRHPKALIKKKKSPIDLYIIYQHVANTKQEIILNTQTRK